MRQSLRSASHSRRWSSESGAPVREASWLTKRIVLAMGFAVSGAERLGSRHEYHTPSPVGQLRTGGPYGGSPSVAGVRPRALDSRYAMTDRPFGIVPMFFVLKVAALLLSLELLGFAGRMPGPRRLALLVGAWAVAALVLPAAARLARNGGRPRQPVPAGLKLGVALSAVAGAFILLETAMARLFPDLPLEIAPGPGSPTPIAQRDVQLRGRFTPGFHGRFLRWPYRGVTMRINPHGFRDRPWSPPAPGTDRPARLLAVGDSFTFGTGVSEQATYPRRLEDLFGGERRLLSFNAGMPGFGPIDELLVLRRHFDEIRPDIVVVGLYTGNDLDDVLLAEKRLTPERSRAEASNPPEPRRAPPGGGWMHLPSMLATLGRANYWVGNSRTCSLAWPGLMSVALRLGWTPTTDIRNSLLLRASAAETDAEVERLIGAVAETLTDADDFCRWRQAKLAIMLIPLRELVEPGAFERALSGIAPGERGGFRREALHERLRSALEERGIPVLDLQPRLRAEAETGSRLFFVEGHLNEAGHREVANALADFLRTRNWLPRGATASRP